MAKRLIHWFEFNILFALFPLMAAWGFRKLGDKPTIAPAAYTQELLFFVLMVCASAIGDLKDSAYPKSDETLFDVLRVILSVGAFVSAILYGALMQDTTGSAGSKVFQSNLFALSLILAVVFFICSTVVEVLLGRKAVLPSVSTGVPNP